MNEPLDDVLNAHTDAARIGRLTHHIQRIREDQHAMREGLGGTPEELDDLFRLVVTL